MELASSFFCPKAFALYRIEFKYDMYSTVPTYIKPNIYSILLWYKIEWHNYIPKRKTPVNNFDIMHGF